MAQDPNKTVRRTSRKRGSVDTDVISARPKPGDPSNTSILIEELKAVEERYGKIIYPEFQIKK